MELDTAIAGIFAISVVAAVGMRVVLLVHRRPATLPLFMGILVTVLVTTAAVFMAVVTSAILDWIFRSRHGGDWLGLSPLIGLIVGGVVSYRILNPWQRSVSKDQKELEDDYRDP